MQLIGFMDSPYVRRVGVTAQFLGIPYEHRELSIFREYDEFRKINPLVKVPTLICDDGQVLVDSTLIIDYLESLAGGKRMMPADEGNYIRALNVIGTALVAMEKVVQLIYELKQRPEEVRHQPWIDRVEQQLGEAVTILEQAVGDGSGWLFDDEVTQPDISTAITWSFIQLHFPETIVEADFPGLVRFSARAEALSEFEACPLS
ncbi:MAG: glutathione S-transferase family protein [Gammaproteobacteria bacterium]|nr:glutathione S-transferase family protein [Gammaproteobacteria bacterium]